MSCYTGAPKLAGSVKVVASRSLNAHSHLILGRGQQDPMSSDGTWRYLELHMGSLSSLSVVNLTECSDGRHRQASSLH